MNKYGPPPPYDPPPTAPPSYAQCVGGVPPASPFTPAETYVNRPLIVPLTIRPLGRDSRHTICPQCHAEIDSAIRTEPGMVAYISGFIIALLGCWAGCCLIPCCIDECMDVYHTCPNCKGYLGRCRR